MSTLVIGCGHPDRGDDSAGLLLARRLRELGIPAEEHVGDGLSLMERWNGAENVIVLDAVRTGAAAGTTRSWDGRLAQVVPEIRRSSSHSLGLAEAIELARQLDRLPLRLEIVGIEGEHFELGTAPCESVLAAVERTALQIAQRLKSDW
ncbi:MAG: hydrogenase maturation protease [Acidobacteriota bacterium]